MNKAPKNEPNGKLLKENVLLVQAAKLWVSLSSKQLSRYIAEPN